VYGEFGGSTGSKMGLRQQTVFCLWKWECDRQRPRLVVCKEQHKGLGGRTC
jgi:hypothetical protein